VSKEIHGEFILDKYFSKLNDRLNLYYKQTPKDMNNKKALNYWFEFKNWARNNGYTQDEINRAKRLVRPFDE
jgi:hypothetical protein